MITNPKYVLITPARNEAKYIRATIESVVNQTSLPLRWAIVSDDSTDGTDEIILEFQKKYPFIIYIRNLERKFKDFRSKVVSFNLGYGAIKNEPFEFIGNIDSDVSFDQNYFALILSKFNENERLGIAGGHLCDVFGKTCKPFMISENSVSGAVQLFRRKCFEEIGGYLPLPMGGIDSAAEIMARAKGWTVRTFFEFRVNHHKPMKTGAGNILHSKTRLGTSNYYMGYHPLFQLFSSLSRLFEEPLILGTVATLYGYIAAAIKKIPKLLPPYAIQYLRKEQINRLVQSLHLNNKKVN